LIGVKEITSINNTFYPEARIKLKDSKFHCLLITFSKTLFSSGVPKDGFDIENHWLLRNLCTRSFSLQTRMFLKEQF